jgi:hypothetical protein
MTTKVNMNSTKTIARTAGVFYIAATVGSSFAYVTMTSMLSTPDYLAQVAANESQVMMAALLMLVDVVCVAGIGIVLYPILKRHSETLALGYTAARAIESVLFAVYVIGILTLIPLSQEFVYAGAPDASHFQTTSTVVVAAADWSFTLGLRLAFGLSALLLNFSLYRTRLVPRWLSAWGFVGAVLILAPLLTGFFGLVLPEGPDFVIAVQEMVFAAWLIVKGFDFSASEPSAVESGRIDMQGVARTTPA